MISYKSQHLTSEAESQYFHIDKSNRSNHQNGIAFDLNTGGFEGAPVYDWMKKNATSFGFIRTVNKEHWHWEYRPQTAEEFRKEGKFKLDRVRK